MTAVIGGISVFIEDDTQRFQQSMVRNASLVEQQTQRMTRALGGTARSVDDLNRKAASFEPDAFRALAISALRADNSIQRLRMSMLATAALAGGGFGGAFALKTLTDTADRYTNIQNRIAAVVQNTRERAQVEQELYDIAQRTRSSFEATAQLYSRMNLSASNLGATQRDILQVVETTQKALLTAGATTQEAASAATQLSQALGAGRLQGDELRSILENAPVLAQAIAKEFGVSVGELKEMGSNGELVASRVFKAILKSTEDVNTRFSQIRPTVASALVVLDNALTKYIGGVDQSLGASAALASGIMALANNLHTLGDAASFAAPLLAAVFANRMIQRGGSAALAPVRAEIAARRDALAAARAGEQVAAERVVNAGMNVQAVRSQARTDLESFAPPDLVRDRARAEKEIGAIDKAIAASGDKQRGLAQRLSEVSVSAGKAGEAAAKREARAIDTLSQKLARELELKREIQQANTIATLRAAANVTGVESNRDVRQAEREVTKLRGELDRLRSEGIPRAKVEAATAAMTVARLNADAEAKDLSQRVALGRQIAAERATVADLYRQRNLTSGVSQAIQGEIDTTARANATRALSQAVLEGTIANAGLARAQQQVAQAAAAASTSNAVFGGVVKSVTAGVTGLIGFLGGPLGAVLTGLTAGWAIYEIAQARAEARLREFMAASEEAVAKLKALQEAQTSAAGVGNALASANATLDTLRRGLPEVIDDTQTQLAALAFARRGSTEYGGLAALSKEFTTASQNGTLTVDILERVKRAAEAMSGLDPDLEPLVQSLLKAANAASTALGRFQQLRSAASLARAERGDFDDARDAQLRRGREADEKRLRDAGKSIDAMVGDAGLPTVPKIVSDQVEKSIVDGATKGTKTMLELQRRAIDLQNQNPGTLSFNQAMSAAKREDALAQSGKKASKTEDEKFADRLARLKEEGKASFFTDLDRELIEELKKIKGDPKLLRDTRQAIEQGTPLPAQAAELRQALALKDAGKEYRGIVEKYGSMAQVLPAVQSEQEKLNLLLESGKITAAQYSLALADYMGKFSQFKWIESFSDSIGNAVYEMTEAARGMKTWQDVAESFKNTLVKLGIQMALIDPLKNMLKGGFAEAANGGTPFSFVSSLFGGSSSTVAPATGVPLPPVRPSVLHAGGVAGGMGPSRSVDPRVFAGAPRFHAGNLGLGAHEIPAILERGEPVLSRKQAKSLGAAVGALGAMRGGGQVVNITPPAGHEPQSVTRESPSGETVDVTFKRVIQEDIGRGGALSTMLERTYGLRRGGGR